MITITLKQQFYFHKYMRLYKFTFTLSIILSCLGFLFAGLGIYQHDFVLILISALFVLAAALLFWELNDINRDHFFRF